MLRRGENVLRKAAAAARAALGALLAPAEDPRATVAGGVRGHAELLDGVRRARGQARAAKDRVRARLAEVEESATGLHARAVAAVQAGDEATALTLLRRRSLALGERDSLHRQALEIAAEEERLAGVEADLEAKLEAVRIRQRLLVARYDAAEAQLRIAESLAGLSRDLGDLDDLDGEVERAEASAERMQARVAAIDRLVMDGALPVPLADLDHGPDAASLQSEAAAELARIRAAATAPDLTEEPR